MGSPVAETIPPITFDPSSQAYLDDPHPFHRRLREQAPVATMAGGFVVLGRYAECAAVLRNPAWELPPTFGCVQTKTDGRDRSVRSVRGLVGAGPDPGDDERLARTAMVREFIKQSSRQASTTMARTANELLDAVLEAGEVDLVEALTAPFINAVSCDLLGVPVADRATVRAWTDDLAGLLDPLALQSAEEADRQTRAGGQLRDYMTDLVAQRRKRPGNDLLSSLIVADDAGKRLSEHELVTISCVLAVGGTFPITSFLGMAVWSLLENPAQLALLRDNRGLVRTAVEELLRYNPPAQFTMRSAPEDTVLGGHTVRAGTQIVALVASANRDGATFAAPEHLDITRADTPHLTFGVGRYHCLGAAFARAEARCLLSTLLDRVPGLTPAGEPEFVRRFTMRSPRRLPVSTR